MYMLSRSSYLKCVSCPIASILIGVMAPIILFIAGYVMSSSFCEFVLAVDLRLMTGYKRGSQLRHPSNDRIAETVRRVIIDESDRLHEGVTDRRADELESSAQQIMAKCV
jgi:hypothetical protein